MKDLDSVKELVKQRVTLGDLLKADKMITGSLDEEQFSCPFHGRDRRKSARYYRETDTAYCWVCKDVWDIFSYVQKREAYSFSQALQFILKTYGIDISNLPSTPEAIIYKAAQRKKVEIDQRKMVLERMHKAIYAVRDEVPGRKYDAFVFGYMALKYMISDENFPGQYQKLKEAMLKCFESMKGPK